MLQWSEWSHKAFFQKTKGQINCIKLQSKVRKNSEWRETEECALVPAFASSLAQKNTIVPDEKIRKLQKLTNVT